MTIVWERERERERERETETETEIDTERHTEREIRLLLAYTPRGKFFCFDMFVLVNIMSIIMNQTRKYVA